ncbi:hypothetical protein [Pelagibacterium sp. H642]|nr:hypothetical protein [Pelagibacterium sp. H642]WMT90113.1 hypothetical protein NO934_15140 [Pelagibacterium sp. H642]
MPDLRLSTLQNRRDARARLAAAIGAGLSLVLLMAIVLGGM